MAWNNKRGYRGNGYHNGNGGYNQNNRGNSGNGGYKKRSGAKLTTYHTQDGEEKRLTSGWKLSKMGELITFMCVTTKHSKESDKGWISSIACTVTNKSNMSKTFYWGVMEKKTGKVVISELGIVLNPRAKNGGYCGTFINNG